MEQKKDQVNHRKHTALTNKKETDSNSENRLTNSHVIQNSKHFTFLEFGQNSVILTKVLEI